MLTNEKPYHRTVLHKHLSVLKKIYFSNTSIIYIILLTIDSWSEETSHCSVMKKTFELFLCMRSVLFIPEGPT